MQSAKVIAAMIDDDCDGPDSNDRFITGNYGVDTTAKIHRHFVFDPEESLSKLGLNEWPNSLVVPNCSHAAAKRGPT